jgi:hypothetical protein
MGSLTLERPVTQAGAEEPQVTRVQDAPAALRPTTPDAPADLLSGSDVLGGGMDYLTRFWIAPYPLAYPLAVAWAAHSWLTEPDGTLAWSNTGLLAFVSDEPLSGKSTGMELTADLCPNAEIILDPTGPAILEAIGERHAVVALDEMDQTFGKGNAARAVKTILNGGYRRGSNIGRVRGGGSPFGAKMLAGLAASLVANPNLEATRTRSFMVYCLPPPPGVKPAKYRESIHKPLGRLAGEAIGAWVRQNAQAILTAWPEMPGHLNGRQEDIWEPLFAVAQVAGGGWPDLIWAACMQLTTGTVTDEATPLPPRQRLLNDIRAVWPQDADRMGSAELVEALSALEGAPWASMWSGPAMLREIPAMLGITPVKVKVDGKPVQGYYLSDLEPLWTSSEEMREQAE